MSSQTLLMPPSLSAPTRRRPSLSPTMSNTRPSPYSTASTSAAGPGRPGMSRTYSFCASSSDQGYASASKSSRTPAAVPVARKRAPAPETSVSSSTRRTQPVAPMMERSISTLGMDGLQVTQIRDGKTGRVTPSPLVRRDSNVDKAEKEPLSVSVPCIVIDEPTPRKPSAAVVPVSPSPSCSSPASPAWSSQYSTPGPVTPNTPFGLRQYDHSPVIVTSPAESEVVMDVDPPIDRPSTASKIPIT